MRIPRLYVPLALSSGKVVELPEQAAAHCQRVLRLREGAALILFDGAGGEYQAQLVEAGKRGVRVQVGAHEAREAESPLRITLGQGVSRGERMDYTLQKSVELGVARIAPLETARSVVNLQGERRERRQQHWQGVVSAACEQCGRNRLPGLDDLAPLAAWLGGTHQGLRLVLHHRGAQRLSQLPPPQALTLLIGPEGGLEEAELAQARQAGFIPLCLGPRILRTETAAVAALSAIQALWGDLG